MLLRFEGVSKEYESPGEEVRVLEDINWDVPSGKSFAVVGESGAGKSTLLHIAGILTPPTKGKMVFCGEDPWKKDDNGRASILKEDIAFVFQFFQLFNDMTLWENVYFAARLIFAEKEAAEKTDSVIATLGLTHRKDHMASLLSGGEKQRTAMGRALVKSPKLILADEPTGNLDEKNSEDIMDLLFKLRKDTGSTLILVTHNRELASRCDETLELVHRKLRSDEVRKDV